MPNVATLDKTGYAYQALIHTRSCPHRNWWFLPWHRAYLFTFEQILRASVADFMPDVPIAIPYWNWTEQMTIPQEFSETTGNNPLYDDRRFSAPLTDEDVGPDAIHRTVDEAGSFSEFGSYPSCAKRTAAHEAPFEAGPHDTVHGSVGGGDDPNDPSTWGTMTTTLTSAFDPIFWSHHANLDRLWNVWRGQPGHQNPAHTEPCPEPGNNVTWGNLLFNEFIDSTGAQISRTVSAFLDDPAISSVSYKAYVPRSLRFARSRTPPGQSAHKFMELTAERPASGAVQLDLNKPVTVTVPVTPEARTLLAERSRQPARAVTFRIDGVKRPVDFTRVRVRAFLNNPKADATTSYKDPSYIGYFAFFDATHGKDHEAAPVGTSYSLNLAPVLDRLGDKVNLEKSLSITFVMVEKAPLARRGNAAAPAVGTTTFKSGKLLIGR